MSNFIIYFLVQFQIVMIGFKIGCAANPYLTFHNVKYVQTDFRSRPFSKLQCYPTNSSTAISMGKVFKISNNDSLAEPTLLRAQSSFVPYAKKVDIPYDGNSFGVYYCKGVLNDKTTIVKTTVVDLDGASDSDVIPTNEKTSITASVGESVTVSFDVASSGNRIWRKDGELLDNYENLYDDASLHFTSVKVDDGGIYELYIDGQRNEYNHSFIQLIVKECPTGRWGAPRCAAICNNCYNGGVCDDKTGNCVCAPGFKGESCEETCGGNRFGFHCENRCTFKGDDPKDRCKGHQYCLPYPYGCSCITGFTGLDCLKGCDSGKFGAGCSQECHCTSGSCNQYTGECTSGTCANGWSGTNCQVPSTCLVGYFSASCTSICHCRDNVECDRNTGVCSNGLCARGYHIYDNSFCEACQSGRYDYNCASTCNCDAASCHHETGCNGGCLKNWLLNTCTTGISATSNTKVNPGQLSIFQCDIEGDVTGVTIQFLQINNNQFATETGRTESNGVTRVTFTGEANLAVPYVCRLSKDYYSAYAEHPLNIFVLPTYTGQPSSLTVTGSSVELSWRNWSTSSGDVGDGPVIGYVVYYKQFSSSGLWTRLPQNSLTATVTGLRWEEEYEFAIAAVREGAGGEGPRGSNKLTVSTVCGEPSAPVVKANSSYTFPKRINIYLQRLTVAESKCSTGVERYTIYYRPVNKDVSMITEKTTIDDFYTIMELETYTEYIISVTASNKDFAGMAGVVEVFSPEEIPPVPGVSATQDGSFLTVSVYPSESFSRNLYGNIIGFDVRYRSRNSKEWKNQTITADQGINGYRIAGVVEDADYEVIASVINGAGVGNWSPFFTAEQSTGSSIPGFMIALVVVLSIIIIFLISLFGLYYRYNHSNGNKVHKCQVDDDKQTKNTRVVEETTELNNYTKLNKDDLIQQEDQYEVIKTETQDTYDVIPHTSGLKVTNSAEENIGDAENKTEPYEITLKQIRHESDEVNNAIPQYTNIK